VSRLARDVRVAPILSTKQHQLPAPDLPEARTLPDRVTAIHAGDGVTSGARADEQPVTGT